MFLLRILQKLTGVWCLLCYLFRPFLHWSSLPLQLRMVPRVWHYLLKICYVASIAKCRLLGSREHMLSFFVSLTDPVTPVDDEDEDDVLEDMAATAETNIHWPSKPALSPFSLHPHRTFLRDRCRHWSWKGWHHSLRLQNALQSSCLLGTCEHDLIWK